MPKRRYEYARLKKNLFQQQSPENDNSIVKFLKTCWKVISAIWIYFEKKLWPKVAIFIALGGFIFAYLRNSPTQKSIADQKFAAENDTGTLKPQPFPSEYTSPPSQYNYETANATISNNPIDFKDSSKTKGPKLKGILIKEFQNHICDSIEIFLGGISYLISKNNLINGAELFHPKLDGCLGTASLKVGLNNNRLYISTNFFDLDLKPTGQIVFNHWDVYVKNRLSIQQNDSLLEIVDNNHNINIAIAYLSIDKMALMNANRNYKLPSVMIAGYFIDRKGIVVFPNNPFDKKTGRVFNASYECFPKAVERWKELAQDQIDNMETIFPGSRPSLKQ